MKNPILKKRKKEDNYYHELQEKTLKRLGELSGKVWTDFNAHDPGITISDYLNYALYDLHYRLQFPFENYLFDSAHERNYSEKGLFPRHELFTEVDNGGRETIRKSIVTESDYEQFVFKQHEHQLEKCAVRLNIQTKRYDFFIHPKNKQLTEAERILLEDSLIKTYNKNRNLGENAGAIHYDWKIQEDANIYSHRKYSNKENYEFPEFDPIENEFSQTVFSPEYHSIQYDFPENYGIGERGIPHPEDQDYQTKVLQLKAYLLIFDYLMADQLKQAGNVHKLFELSEHLPKEILPYVKIVEGERIIDTDKKEKVTDILRNDKFYQLQKFRYLNVLDTLYGENTRTLFGKKDIPTLNQKRSEILKSLPKLNEYRFRSFNIDEPNSIPVIQQLLEDVVKERFPGHTSVKNGKIRIIADELFNERYRFLLVGHRDPLDKHEQINEPVYAHLNYKEEKSFEQLRLHMNLIWHGVIPESLLNYGTDLSNYKIATVSDDYLLLFFHPENKLIINMSLFSSDKKKLIETTYLFIDFIRQIKANGYQQTLYLVEHILFDPDQKNSDLLSIVIPEKLKSHEMEELIRERLPAHLRITIYYVSPGALENFHTAYFNWRKALSGKNEKDISYYSGAIQFFFNYAEKSAKQI